ncbi:hypothetical protein H7H78_10650 [Mycobacterium shinjukuense]|uniref:Uncharacterized protein n=1 Tax=Mycobacterium shinjukuense TaxID=398694 RepID=A0A7I7MNF0_9MYCO|nr:Rv1535 family protein [Mycobacterium shinjukuense]MCV6985873.1 hypothetical protein [Mycobacterium shinjukuense]ORB71736.1 hypothetical protein BST45_01710 [Mycobacterium shinjukuense]BBX73758.1 hypothetical protein MSHI_16640 [Mycobacterium shinjukuense]
MTAALNEVVTAAPAPRLHVVREEAPIEAAQKVTRRRDTRPVIVIRDPLVDGAAGLLSIPLRHMYAALWRIGVLDVHA